jgi:hypothetical protein
MALRGDFGGLNKIFPFFHPRDLIDISITLRLQN